MRYTTPQIAWHNRDPVYSVDVQPTPIRSGVGETVYRLASGGTDSHVVIWHLKVPTEDAEPTVVFASDLHRHQRAVNVVRFSPSGDILASGDDESVVMLWRQKTEKGASGELWLDAAAQGTEQWVMTKILRGHHEDVYDLSWSPDSLYLLSGSVDNTAIIWNIAKGKHEEILSDHKGFVQGVAWDPKNKYIATLSSDRICRIFNVHSKRVVKRICKSRVGKFGMGPDGKEKTYHLFHDDTFKSFFRRLTFSPNGELLIAPSGVMDVVKKSHKDGGKGKNNTKHKVEQEEPKIKAKATVAAAGAGPEVEPEAGSGAEVEPEAGSGAEVEPEAGSGAETEAKLPSSQAMEVEDNDNQEKNDEVDELDSVNELDTSGSSSNTDTPSSSELEESFTEDKDTVVILTLENSRKMRKPRPRRKHKKSHDNNHNTIQIFSRHEFNRPAVFLPTGTKYTIAVRCCPILFELRSCCTLEDWMAAREKKKDCGNEQEGEKGKEEDKTDRPIWEQKNSLFPLPYRVVFAVATHDSILVYDTQQVVPICTFTNNHYARLSDVTWSSDGLVLIASSTDGYCTIITFLPGELGEPYHPKPCESLEDTTVAAPNSEIGNAKKSLNIDSVDDEDEDFRLVLEDTLTEVEQKNDAFSSVNSGTLADKSTSSEARSTPEVYFQSDAGKAVDIAHQGLNFSAQSSVNNTVADEIVQKSPVAEVKKDAEDETQNGSFNIAAEKDKSVGHTTNCNKEKNQDLNSLQVIDNRNENQDKSIKLVDSTNVSKMEISSPNSKSMGNGSEKQSGEVNLTVANSDTERQVLSPQKNEKTLNNLNQEAEVKSNGTNNNNKMKTGTPNKDTKTAAHGNKKQDAALKSAYSNSDKNVKVSPRKDESKLLTPVKCTPHQHDVLSPSIGSPSVVTPSKSSPRRVPFVTLSSPKSKRSLI